MARLRPEGLMAGLAVDDVMDRVGVCEPVASESSAQHMLGLSKPLIMTPAGAPGFIPFFARFFFLWAAFSLDVRSESVVAFPC